MYSCQTESLKVFL